MSELALRTASGGTPALQKLVGVFVLLFVIGWPFMVGDYLIGVGIILLMWIAYTESWIVLSGMTGYFSFGHVVFAGLGAYILVHLWNVVPIWVAVLVAGGASGLLALIVGYPCLRVRGPYFVILTFGVAELVKNIVINIEAALSSSGRPLLGVPDTLTIYYSMAVLALAAFLLAWYVRRSRFGAGLRAIREDEDAAETMGIPVTRYKLTAFVLSAIIPGMAGAVIVMRGGYFEPLQAFNPTVSLTMIAMAILGGSDDAPGPLFGCVFLAVLHELLWSTFPLLYQILIGLVLILFVLSAPDGIWGRLQTYGRRRELARAS